MSDKKRRKRAQQELADILETVCGVEGDEALTLAKRLREELSQNGLCIRDVPAPRTFRLPQLPRSWH